jgi:hypothetical protein
LSKTALGRGGGEDLKDASCVSEVIMESLEDYLSRKYEELKLLSGALSGVTSVRRPRSIEEVIEQKFKLAEC